MIIDAHTHLSAEFMGMKGITAAELVAQLDSNNVDKCIMCTLEGFISDTRRANDELAKCAREFPDRLCAWCTVNPYEGREAVAELRRCVEELGMSGCKLHPWLQGFSVSGAYMFAIVETCIELGIPLIFHDGTPPFSTPLQIANLARIYPEIAIILAHSGLRDLWPNAIAAAKNCPNIWLCTCGTPLFGIQRIADEIGTDRVVFGSDAGFGCPKRITRELMKIDCLDISSEQKERILGQNAAGFVSSK